MNATVDTTRANIALTRYVTELKQEPGEVIRREMRLLLQQCIKFTPPKTYEQGRKAIARDIRRAVKQPTEEWLSTIHNEKLQMRMRLALAGNDTEKFTALMKVLSPKWEVVGFDPAMHQGVRDARGRVQGKKWARISLQMKQWAKYTTMIQKRAGMMRASWVPALNAAGGKAAQWIERKTTKHGTFLDASRNPNPFFSATSNANGITEFSRIYQNALKSRGASMESNIRRLLREAKQKASL